jgi:hypothetical protein
VAVLSSVEAMDISGNRIVLPIVDTCLRACLNWFVADYDEYELEEAEEDESDAKEPAVRLWTRFFCVLRASIFFARRYFCRFNSRVNAEAKAAKRFVPGTAFDFDFDLLLDGFTAIFVVKRYQRRFCTIHHPLSIPLRTVPSFTLVALMSGPFRATGLPRT